VIATKATGFFGKLPAHGDFIFRELPPSFINVIDRWLQGYVGSSQEQLGESWLDIYLTSPIWRFAFSAGVVDHNAWVGIVLPSVDRVGRYFPLVVATCVPANINPSAFMALRLNWYQSLEEAALRALDGSLTVDALVEELNDSNPRLVGQYSRAPQRVQQPTKMVVKTGGGDSTPAAAMPYLLDACLGAAMDSYSIWSTTGSQVIDPCVFVCKGLPPLDGVAAMLDGQWAQWHWQQPFAMNE